MRCTLVTSVSLALACAAAAAAWTSPATAAANGLPDTLIVGTKPTPPFAIKGEDGCGAVCPSTCGKRCTAIQTPWWTRTVQRYLGK